MFSIESKMLVVVAITLTAGCEKRPDTDNSTSPPAATESVQHAPASVRPGSHEDWCGEHQVPETMCTRCSASLIPAFKATGDWCVEHNLPESQCLICNPKLKIERPPATEGATP